jgi:hypothetical protein
MNMHKRMRQSLAYLLVMTLLLMSVPAPLYASTGDSDPIVIDNIIDDVLNPGEYLYVMSVVGLSGGNTGILYATLDENWSYIKQRYKVVDTAGTVLSNVDLGAILGARASNVSTFAAYAIADGKAVITWEGTNNGCGGAFQFTIIDEDGTVVKGATDISTSAAPYNCYTGTAELSNGNIAFMWQAQGDEYLYRIFDAAGNAVTSPASVEKGGTRQDNFAHNSTYTHSLAANDQGQFLINYDINSNNNYIGAMYDNDGTRRLTNGFHHYYLGPKPSNSGSYNIGLTSGDFGVFFYTASTLTMNIINSLGAVQTSIASGLIKDDNAGGALAVNGGGFLVYDTSTVGSDTYLYTKHFGADGTLLKDWTQRSSGSVLDYNAGYYSFEPFIFAGYDSGFGYYNTVSNQLVLYDMGVVAPTAPAEIVEQPSNITVDAGGDAIFTVSATDAISYQWEVDTGSGYNNVTDGGVYIGATSDTLYINEAPLSMNGYIYRVIVNGTASSTAISNAASLTVNPLANAATPSIGTHPAEQDISINGTATLSVAATVSDSGSLSYQWYSNTTNNNSGGTLIPAATSSSYTAPTAATGVTYYYAVVTNTNNGVNGTKTATATTNAAKVTVNAVPTSFTVSETGTLTFEALTQGYTATEANGIKESVTLTKVGTGAITNLAVGFSGGASSAFTTGTVNPTSLGAGVLSTVMQVFPKTGLAPGTYTETVTITADGGLSESFQVSFTVSPSPTSFTVSETGTVTFDALIQGYNTTQVNGIKESVTLTKVGTGAIMNLAVGFSGGASSAFTTGTVNPDSLGAGVLSTVMQVFPKTGLAPGTYTETVTITADGSLSESFQVSFTVNPSTFTVSETGTVTFDALIQGYNTTQVNGIKESVTLTKVGTGAITNLAVGFSGGTSSAFTTGTVNPTSLGAGVLSTVIQVFPKTGLAPGTYTETVTITADGGLSESFQVSFTVSPSPTSFTVSETGTVTFDALIQGYNTTQVNGIKESVTLTKVGTGAITNLAVGFSGGTSSAFTTGTVNPDSLGAGVLSTVMQVFPKTGLVPGTYAETVTITADGGLSESFQVSFTVNPSTFTVSETGTVTFDALIQGYTTTQVNGIKESITLTKVGNGAISNLAVSFSGGASSSFTTGTVNPDSLGAGVLSTVMQVFPKTGLAPGTYAETVTITADGGLSESFQVSFTVITLVHAATPVINKQPVSETIDKGADVTLNVGATISDSGTLYYQWFRNTTNSTVGGTSIEGENSETYEVPTDTAGTYYYYAGAININNSVNGIKIVSTLSDIAEVTVLEHALAPTITTQLEDEVVDVGDSGILSVAAISVDGGTLSYQWYSNTTNSTVGGSAINGANSATYELPTETAGVFHYYVVITNTNNSVNGTKTASTTSSVAEVTVLLHTSAPSITLQPADEAVNVEASETLSVTAHSVDGGTLSYQWYSNTTNSTVGGTAINGANSATYEVPTEAAGVFYYYVVITNTNNSVNGTKTASTTSSVAEVTVLLHALAPSITTQPLTQTAIYGSTKTLNVTATTNDSGVLSYQWFSNTAASTLGGTLIDGATQSSYTIPTNAAGSFYYYVIVTNTNNSVNGTNSANATSSVAEVTVIHTYEIAEVAEQAASPLIQGFAEGELKTITITNTGTGVLANLAVAVSGNDAENFVVTQPNASLNAGEATSFTIQAKAGLTAATYSMTVTISATNMSNKSFAFTQVVVLPDPPAKPQQVSATRGNSQVVLAWDVVVGATYYDVYRVTGEEHYTLIDTVAAPSYTVESLVNGTEYSFVIRAGNPGGISDYSAQVQAVPATVAAAPSDVSATAGDRQATIRFTAPVDNGGSEITGYEVIASPGNIVTTGSASPIVVKGLTNGESYTFTVRAINGAGKSEVSLPSSEIIPRVPSNTEPSTQPSTEPRSEAESVEVIINGKVESAGIAKKETINGQLVTTIIVDEEKIMERLAVEGDQAVITIPFISSSDVVIGEINGQLMKALEDKDATVVIRTEHATYTLPSREIDIAALAAQLGSNIDLQDIKLLIKIAAPSTAAIENVEEAVTANGLTIVAAPLDFTISATYGDASIEITNFSAYVERSIAIPTDIDPAKITTGIVIEEDGSIRHVPTNVETIDGQYYARINSLTNSVYSVIWNTVAYEDAATHWASNSIHNMGARLIVNGVSEGQFAPNRNITRAEFAAIMVRALGLKLQPSQGVFTDVEQSAWYSSVVQTAYAYGLINGFQDGTFRPQESITRQQAMLMISKAMLITGLQGADNGDNGASVVDSYKDSGQVASWALVGVADAVSAGIVSGRSDHSLAPQEAITRAEVAVMIERLLQNSGLINKEPLKQASVN